MSHQGIDLSLEEQQVDYDMIDEMFHGIEDEENSGEQVVPGEHMGNKMGENKVGGELLEELQFNIMLAGENLVLLNEIPFPDPIMFHPNEDNENFLELQQRCERVVFTLNDEEYAQNEYNEEFHYIIRRAHYHDNAAQQRSDFVSFIIELQVGHLRWIPPPSYSQMLREFRRVLYRDSSRLEIFPESLEILEQTGSAHNQLVFTFSDDNMVVAIRLVPRADYRIP